MNASADLSQQSAVSEVEDSPLDQILTQSDSQPPTADTGLPSVVTAQCVSLKNSRPIVKYRGQELQARSVLRPTDALIGRDVVLSFENGDESLPIIMGVLENPAVELPIMDEETTATVDGRRVELKAKERIELKCGKASIILTAAGKVLIKGAYVSSRSTGAQRIRGGSVHIN
tara:strand:- start:187 stop:705 length:519 start_codon:yes stop_codon:yes gene_type:complete